jgi:hypothetical protein
MADLMQTIETVKDWSTPEVAELLGSNDARIRQLKSNHGNELIEGEDFTKDEQSKTRWTKAGIKKLASWLQTERAIALRNGAELSQPKSEIKVHETHVKTESVGSPLDRYADLPDVLGAAIADRMLDDGFLRQTDAAVVGKLTKAMMSQQADLQVTVKQAFDLLNAIAA